VSDGISNYKVGIEPSSKTFIDITPLPGDGDNYRLSLYMAVLTEDGTPQSMRVTKYNHIFKRIA